ncbi:ApaLI family restriction endonuclease [Micromonospora sediminicola]|uniref:ApaLI family restriction endonuclease n=1 Tax=Micromonospora sediminicola TaxID=946078 RepID=UPI0033CD5F52
MIETKLQDLAVRIRDSLAAQVEARRQELEADDTSHQELYRILGVPPSECAKIDLYQNVGRFVYKYAGALLEAATQLCLAETGDGGRLLLPNTVSSSPAQFEIDCYTRKDNKAHEIKWRDATTDGDHIKKEHNKIQAIVAAGHTPVRIMYYMPVRAQAIRIQQRILAEFRKQGEAYVGDEAWSYVRAYSGVDLRAELRKLDIPHAGWSKFVQ